MSFLCIFNVRCIFTYAIDGDNIIGNHWYDIYKVDGTLFQIAFVYFRVIIIQPITEEILKDSKKKLHESNKIFSAKLTGKNNEKKDRKLNSEVLNEETVVFLTNTNSTSTTATTQQANANAEAVIDLR